MAVQKRKQKGVRDRKSRNPNRQWKYKYRFPPRVAKRKDANVRKSSNGKFVSVEALEAHRKAASG